MSWVSIHDGRALDLLQPDAALIDFRFDVAPRLSRLARFAGATDPLYSVAEHCVRGAQAMLAEGQPADNAIAFLLHDAAEAYLGDQTRPYQAAVQAMADEHYGNAGCLSPPSLMVRAAHRALHGKLDHAIWRAAGFHHPPGNGTQIAEAVKDMDTRMLRVERDHLLPRQTTSWGDEIETARPIRGLRGVIRPWAPFKAAEEWLGMFLQLAPPATAARYRREAA